MGTLGGPEMLIIFLLALVLFGPKKLPELGRTIGKALTEFRRASNDLKSSFEREMNHLERETESFKEVTHSVSNEIKAYTDVHTEVKNEIKSYTDFSAFYDEDGSQIKPATPNPSPT